MRNPLSIAGVSLLVISLLVYFLLLDRCGKTGRKVNYARLGVMLSLALILGFIESMLPDIFLPGVKLGLSNVAILIVIYVYGAKEGLLLAVLKALLVSFFSGTFMSMGGFMSITGSLLSAIFMILLHIVAKGFSPIAVSLIGALAHILGQLLIGYAYLGGAVWVYAPLSLVLAGATGVLTGILACVLLRQKGFLSYLTRT